MKEKLKDGLLLSIIGPILFIAILVTLIGLLLFVVISAPFRVIRYLRLKKIIGSANGLIFITRSPSRWDHYLHWNAALLADAQIIDAKVDPAKVQAIRSLVGLDLRSLSSGLLAEGNIFVLRFKKRAWLEYLLLGSAADYQLIGRSEQKLEQFMRK